MNQKTAVFGIMLILAVSITGKLYLESQIEQDITVKIQQAVTDLSQPEMLFTLTHDPVSYSLLNNSTTINNIVVNAQSDAFVMAQSEIEKLVIVDYQQDQGIGEVALSNAVISVEDNNQQAFEITLADLLVKDITQAYINDIATVSQLVYQLAEQVISVEQFEESVANTFNSPLTPISEIELNALHFAHNGEKIAGIRSISQLNSNMVDGMATKSIAQMQEMTLSFAPFIEVNPQLPMMIEAYLGKPVDEFTLDMNSHTEFDAGNLLGMITLSERNTFAIDMGFDIDNIDLKELFELQKRFQQGDAEPHVMFEELLNDPALDDVFINDFTLTINDNGMIKHHINSTPGMVNIVKQQMQMSAPMLDEFQTGLSDQLRTAIDNGVTQDKVSLSIGIEQKPNTQLKNALQVQAPMTLNQFLKVTIAN